MYAPSRLALLPTQLHVFIQNRLASTATARPESAFHPDPPPRTNPFPYPTHTRPTPHQIFHLPQGASQRDIKSRYYDLVRAHHPDSVHSRALAAAERHARFQAITAAYDALRGRAPSSPAFDPYAEEIRRRKSAFHAHNRRHAEHAADLNARREWDASGDDRWKDRMIIVLGLMTLAAGLAPGLFLLPWHLEQRHRAAVDNLAKARNDARDYGEERRRELRRRVREYKAMLLLQEEEARRGGMRRDNNDSEPRQA